MSRRLKDDTTERELNKIATIVELMVDVSKGHIKLEEFYARVHQLHLSDVYRELKYQLERKEDYLCALSDIEQSPYGESLRHILEKYLT